MRQLLIIAESLSGNTITFVERVEREYSDSWSVKVATPFDVNYNDLKESDKIMIGCYTWSNGKIPRETKEMVIDYRNLLLSKDVLIFGSGWSIYQNYCGAVDGIGIILNNKFPKIKFELMYDEEIEIEAEETLKDYMEERNYGELLRERTGYEDSYLI